jgi:hypothetical protein
MKILDFFLFLVVIFALLDPDPHLNADPDPATQINADPSGSETLIKSHKEVAKQYEFNVFLPISLDDRRFRIRSRISD